MRTLWSINKLPKYKKALLRFHVHTLQGRKFRLSGWRDEKFFLHKLAWEQKYFFGDSFIFENFLIFLAFKSFSNFWPNSYKMFFILDIVGNKAKRRILKRVFQENKARQIFRKTNISYPLISTRTRAYHGVRNVHFSENLACFVFLKYPFWDSPFCLITDDIKYRFICGESNLYQNLVRSFIRLCHRLRVFVFFAFADEI